MFFLWLVCSLPLLVVLAYIQGDSGCIWMLFSSFSSTVTIFKSFIYSIYFHVQSIFIQCDWFWQFQKFRLPISCIYSWIDVDSLPQSTWPWPVAQWPGVMPTFAAVLHESWQQGLQISWTAIGRYSIMLLFTEFTVLICIQVCWVIWKSYRNLMWLTNHQMNFPFDFCCLIGLFPWAGFFFHTFPSCACSILFNSNHTFFHAIEAAQSVAKRKSP